MWSIIFSRSASGNFSVAITFRLLLMFSGPRKSNVGGGLSISDNLDASGEARDANPLQSPNFHTIQPTVCKAPHPVGDKGARRKTHSTLKLFELPDFFSRWSDHGGRLQVYKGRGAAGRRKLL